MWSMWNAPSDRDYYGSEDEPEPEDICLDCGAEPGEACEEWCETRKPASEPAPAPPDDLLAW